MKTLSNYFYYFDEKFKAENLDTLYEHYRSLKSLISSQVALVSEQNFLSVLEVVLITDAKIHIITELMTDNFFDLSQEEIIDLAEKDSLVYYQQMMGGEIHLENSLLDLSNIKNF
jgi:hypothetical protein